MSEEMVTITIKVPKHFEASMRDIVKMFIAPEMKTKLIGCVAGAAWVSEDNAIIAVNTCPYNEENIISRVHAAVGYGALSGGLAVACEVAAQEALAAGGCAHVYESFTEGMLHILGGASGAKAGRTFDEVKEAVIMARKCEPNGKG